MTTKMKTKYLPFTIGGAKYHVPLVVDTVSGKCQCCGNEDFGEQCKNCLKHACNDCLDLSDCLICAVGKNVILSDKQQERLVNLYARNGFQFEKASVKIDILSKL